MAGELARKFAQLMVVLWLVSLATFFMLELVPGDPASAVLGTSGTPEQYERVRAELGLDRAVHLRYLDWVSGAVQGDFGDSLAPPYASVADTLRARLPVTIEIAALGMVFALAAALPIGVWSAHRVGSTFDTVSSGAMFALISLPGFVAGLMLIQLFVFRPSVPRVIVGLVGLAVLAGAVRRARSARGVPQEFRRRVTSACLLGVVLVGVLVAWPTFPRQGFSRLTADAGLMANLEHAFLPAVTIALGELALFARVLRAEMLTTLEADFVLAAKARGMPATRVLWRDALRPSSFSIVTVAGISLGRLLGGTVIVEVIFNLPGMGRLLVDSIGTKDFVTVQAAVLVLATLYVLVNGLVDLSYTLLDPRVRNAAR